MLIYDLFEGIFTLMVDKILEPVILNFKNCVFISKTN